MRVRTLAAAAAASLFCVGAGLAAEPSVGGLDKAAASTGDPFEQMLAARRVADFARRRHDPLAMLVAAKMLHEVPFRDQSPPAVHAEGAAAPAEFTPEGLFREAKGLANGDPQLLTQIRIAEASGSRGVMSSIFGAGLVRVVQDLGGRAAYGFPIEAKGGEVLRIGAIGDVTTHMTMRLRDPHGKVICDDGGDYAPVCSFKPASATALKVEILNQGANPTRAVILSN